MSRAQALAAAMFDVQSEASLWYDGDLCNSWLWKEVKQTKKRAFSGSPVLYSTPRRPEPMK